MTYSLKGNSDATAHEWASEPSFWLLKVGISHLASDTGELCLTALPTYTC